MCIIRKFLLSAYLLGLYYSVNAMEHPNYTKDEIEQTSSDYSAMREACRKERENGRSIEDLYQIGLSYRDGKVKGYLKGSALTNRWAETYFYEAALQGHLKAIHNYAMLLYKKGEYQEAYKWFQAAAKGGLEPSKRNLLLMKKEGKVKLTPDLCFDDFPLEIKIGILSNCTIGTLLNVRQISKQMKELADTNDVWLAQAKLFNIYPNKNHFIPYKMQLLRDLQFERGIIDWQSIKDSHVITAADKSVLNNAITSLNFAAIHGHSEAAIALREIFDWFHGKRDEDAQGINLYLLTSILDTAIYPILSVPQLEQATDEVFYSIMSKTIVEDLDWPSSLYKRFRSILVKKGHPTWAKALKLLEKQDKIEEEDNIYYIANMHHMLADERFIHNIQEGIEKAVREEDYEQLDLWLGYKYLKLNAEMEINPSFLEDINFTEILSYLPSTFSLHQLPKLPITSQYLLSFLEEYYDYHRSLLEAATTNYPSKSIAILEKCSIFYMDQFAVDRIPLYLLDSLPQGTLLTDSNVLMNYKNFTSYISNIKNNLYYQHPAYYYRSYATGAGAHINKCLGNPLARKLMHENVKFIETYYNDNVPISYLNVFSLIPDYDNFYKLSAPQQLLDRLQSYSKRPDIRKELDKQEETKIAHGLMFLYYNLGKQDEAIQQIVYCLQDFLNNPAVCVEEIESEMVFTMLEISLRWKSESLLYSLLLNPKVIEILKKQIISEFLFNRYVGGLYAINSPGSPYKLLPFLLNSYFSQQ